MRKNKGKNIIFAKKSQKICIFQFFFVTLQPINSVVRIMRTVAVCEQLIKNTIIHSNKYEKTFPYACSDCNGSPDIM